jgi:hypothetical protein
MNNQRNFAPLQIERLGKYIYVLRDPRDKKLFYVGQGTANRVFNHFDKADAVNKEAVNLQTLSSKTLRILETERLGMSVYKDRKPAYNSTFEDMAGLVVKETFCF